MNQVHLHLVPSPTPSAPNTAEVVEAAQAQTRRDITTVLRAVHLSHQVQKRITQALTDIAAGRGAESTIEMIIAQATEPSQKNEISKEETTRQDVIKFIGTGLLKAVEEKITKLEQTRFQDCNRAGLIPLELALFARYAQTIDSKLADQYRARFLKLYTRIMSAASDEDLRKNNTGTPISADWPSYCTVLKRDILNPIFMNIAMDNLSTETEIALHAAEPVMKRFDKQATYTGVTLLAPENILGQTQVIDMKTHPLGVRDEKSKATYTSRLKKYFDV